MNSNQLHLPASTKRNAKGQFISNNQIKITKKGWTHNRIRPNRYESDTWISQSTFAIRKTSVSNLNEVMNYPRLNHFEKDDETFLEFSNYEKEPFKKTTFLKDIDGVLTRIFQNNQGKCICINEYLCKMFKIEGLLYGGFEQPFVTLDQNVLIMPFSKWVNISIHND